MRQPLVLQMNYYADYFTESILGIWEETLKSVVREGFTNTTRCALDSS